MTARPYRPKALNVCACCSAEYPPAAFYIMSGETRSCYCIACKAAFDRAVKDGFEGGWPEFRRELAARARVAARAAFRAQAAALGEAALMEALRAIYSAGGMAAVVLAVGLASKRLAADNRADMTREGWIV